MAKAALKKLEKLVETAGDPASPLHRFFDWNDSRAAKKWREHPTMLSRPRPTREA